jgi:GNAT superfamily N-acetyltransferase
VGSKKTQTSRLRGILCFFDGRSDAEPPDEAASRGRGNSIATAIELSVTMKTNGAVESCGPKQIIKKCYRVRMNVAIREGTEADFPVLLSLVKELAAFEKEPEGVVNTIEQMTREKDLFKFLLADVDGEAIGMIVYFFTYSTWKGKTLYVEDLYVKEAYRGQKIGTAFLKRMFEIAQAEGCGRLRWQVIDWNEDAIKFYRKLGAKMDDKWHNCDFDAAAIARVLTQM